MSQSSLTDHEKDSTHPESDHHGAPAYIRSDNGPECVVNTVRSHLSHLDVVTRFIAPDAPWENGYIESFNGTFRNELLNREVFGHLLEAKVLGEKYRQEYNTERPHSSLDYQTPSELAATQVETPVLTPAPVHSPWYRNRGTPRVVRSFGVLIVAEPIIKKWDIIVRN